MIGAQLVHKLLFYHFPIYIYIYIYMGLDTCTITCAQPTHMGETHPLRWVPSMWVVVHQAFSYIYIYILDYGTMYVLYIYMGWMIYIKYSNVLSCVLTVYSK
jgi:hypothetical protein